MNVDNDKNSIKLHFEEVKKLLDMTQSVLRNYVHSMTECAKLKQKIRELEEQNDRT